MAYKAHDLERFAIACTGQYRER